MAAEAARRRAPPRPPPRVIPRATYRVQLHRDFRFADAEALVPYLARLGVSHLYCSPFLRARPGSRHGYDIVDHQHLNPEIGSRADLERLVATLRRHGMGLLADVVPNHMGVHGADNGWWMDVLEHGSASAHAGSFDIDWSAVPPGRGGRVLLPILGDPYGVVLERGELVPAFEAERGSLVLRYWGHRMPFDPASYPRLLAPAVAALDGAEAEALRALAEGFGRLPARDRLDADSLARRHRESEALKADLAALAAARPPVAAAIAAALAALQGRPGERSSFDALDALLDEQAWRLAFWRVAADEINYRRFFDINELAALRMEDPRVFDATHRLLLDAVRDGLVDGLRIDHPDGLLDPAAYFRRLQQACGGEAGAPLYVVVEKILAPHERLPADWPVSGTTGYRFANVLTGLFVDTAARARLDRAWRAFAGDEARDFERLAVECRRLVMHGSLAGELGVLAAELHRLAAADRRTRDFTRPTLQRTLAEVVAHFPVYRTYLAGPPSDADRRTIEWAVARAARRHDGPDASVFDFVRRVLLAEAMPDAPERLRAGVQAFARRVQQFTAPVAAKGIEDTALYRHQRLVALNEVGGSPDDFGFTVRAFHGASRDRAAHWPHTMLAGSTHDTKRSEDLRARLAVISEMPAAWRLSVRRWSRWSRAHRGELDGRPAPSRNDEYLLYQTLAGLLPSRLDEATLAACRERVEAYLLKAAREARCRTSWTVPDTPYEAALRRFVGGVLGRLEGNPLLDDLRRAAATFEWYGALNGVSMAAIRFSSPGVPDLYQGSETIELSLVDPDNRRAVDFDARRAALDALESLAGTTPRTALLRTLAGAAPDGRAKLWVLWRLLQLRRAQPALFAHGDYRGLAVQGGRAHHVVAYARRLGGQRLLVVAGRLYASLGLAAGEPPIGPAWGDTAVAPPPLEGPQRFTEVFSGATVELLPGRPQPLAQLLADFPVAVLHGGPAAG